MMSDDLITYVCVKCKAEHFYPPGVDPHTRCQGEDRTCQGALKRADGCEDNDEDEYEDDFNLYRM